MRDDSIFFSSTWFLLEQEGLLAQACLCNGLTALRWANLGDKKGLFYSAFFELSIGFERVLKLIVILDYMAKNKLTLPDSKSIEKYGHKLHSLFEATKDVCATHGVNVLNEFQTDSLPIVILRFLDDFAHPGGRYSNINKLTGHKHQTMADPLMQWGKIANQIVQRNASPRQRKRAQMMGQIASEVIDDIGLSLINDMNQQRLEVAPLFTRTSELETAAKLSIYALVTLIAALREVIESLCDIAWEINPPGKHRVSDVPNMKEFFQFAWADRQYVMRKRRWP